MDNKKILFLDIDGVLNTAASQKLYGCATPNNLVGFDPTATALLRKIIAETGCKVVMSSTWRWGKSVPQMKSWFDFDIPIVGKTEASAPDKPRAQRILDWCNSHQEITSGAIIDDLDVEALHDSCKAFKVSPIHGIDAVCYEGVVSHLGK